MSRVANDSRVIGGSIYSSPRLIAGFRVAAPAQMKAVASGLSTRQRRNSPHRCAMATASGARGTPNDDTLLRDRSQALRGFFDGSGFDAGLQQSNYCLPGIFPESIQRDYGSGAPFGHSSHIPPSCFIMPACPPASAPKPKNRSARMGPRMAPPVSCATTSLCSGSVVPG